MVPTETNAPTRLFLVLETVDNYKYDTDSD